ncbi:MAG: S-adenosylmethionine:tRNA ribosyltransferase-isomerase, partial [Solirubrobacteraceae bacterium]
MTAAAFELPRRLEAYEPPEARGLARDEVRMLVASRAYGEISHRRVRDLPAVIAPGDLLVVNTSATLPAALTA